MTDSDWSDPGNLFTAESAFQWLHDNVPVRLPRVLYRGMILGPRLAQMMERRQDLLPVPGRPFQSFASQRSIALSEVVKIHGSPEGKILVLFTWQPQKDLIQFGMPDLVAKFGMRELDNWHHQREYVVRVDQPLTGKIELIR